MSRPVSPKKGGGSRKGTEEYMQDNDIIAEVGEAYATEPGPGGETQMVSLEAQMTLEPEKIPERNPQADPQVNPQVDAPEEKEVLWELKTFNFVLLLAGLVFGMGLGYVIWAFIRKDLVFWMCAALGLIVAKILENRHFTQNLVRIWSAKSVEAMLKPPRDWKDTFGAGCELFVQSDMYDIDKTYVRSTAVYHNKNTCALTVRERFVRRTRVVNELTITSPYGMVAIATVSLIFAVGNYLRDESAEPNISTAIFCFVVLAPVILLIGCIIELELRKRRLLAFAEAQDKVTYVPLHTIGKIERKTYGGDHWKILYTPPIASTKWRVFKKILFFIALPFILFFKLCAAILGLTTYNGAFAIWLWHCVATVVLYLAHVKKEVRYVEPCMTLLWITFAVNVFEIWYCGPVNQCMDTCGVDKDSKKQLRKLELESETRLPKEKVRTVVVGFCISLALVFISAFAMSAVTNNIFTNVEFFGVDKTWKQSYRENKKFIFCEIDEDDSRRLMPTFEVKKEEHISFANEFMAAELRETTLRSKFSSDYDAMCRENTYRATSVSVAFCTINWFFLLFLAMYWHRFDKYQTSMKYHDNNIVWHDFTKFYIHSVPSKIAWLGRVIGRHKPETFCFFMHPNDATILYRYLTANVPWYAHLNPNQPGARELMPMN